MKNQNKKNFFGFDVSDELERTVSDCNTHYYGKMIVSLFKVVKQKIESLT